MKLIGRSLGFAFLSFALSSCYNSTSGSCENFNPYGFTWQKITSTTPAVPATDTSPTLMIIEPGNQMCSIQVTNGAILDPTKPLYRAQYIIKDRKISVYYVCKGNCTSTSVGVLPQQPSATATFSLTNCSATPRLSFSFINPTTGKSTGAPDDNYVVSATGGSCGNAPITPTN